MAMTNTWCVGHNPPPCPGGYESWWWSTAWVGDKSGVDVVEMVELSCSEVELLEERSSGLPGAGQAPG